MAPVALTWRALNRATLARQHLLARTSPLVDTIEHLVGLQAQLARPPFVGLWSRVDGMTRQALIELFAKRRVVRATSLRGTIHVMSARDFLRLRPAMQPALDRGMTAILGKRLDAIDLGALETLARAFFAEPRTFDAFRDHLVEHHPGGDERAMAYAMRMRVPLVQVPAQDVDWGFPGQADFVLGDAWLGRAPKGSAAPDDLLLRYLAAYGPASIADMQAWSGLPALKPVVTKLRDRLRVFADPGGTELFDLPEAPRPDPDAPAPVRFLPEYDNLLVGRADERVLAAEHRKRVFLSALRVASVVLVDGRAAGVWKVTRTKKVATLTVEAFAALPARVRREVEDEGSRLLAFVEPDAPARNVAMT